MPSISIPTAVAIAGTAVSAGTAIAGAAKGSGAAGQAAGATQQQQAQTRADLLPYNQAGQAALPTLQDYATSGPLAGGPDYIGQAAGERPGMSLADLQATPGYQFTLAEGLKAVQSSRAAKGLGVSGAALKGAATYATGLADSTYANRFNEQQQRFSDLLSLNTGYQGNVTNAYNRALGTATLGENAAAQTGQQGTTAAGNQANALMAGGQAQGAGMVGVGNAIAGGAQNYLKYDAMRQGASSGQTSGYQIPGATGGVYSSAPPAPISIPVIPASSGY